MNEWVFNEKPLDSQLLYDYNLVNPLLLDI